MKQNTKTKKQNYWKEQSKREKKKERLGKERMN
jgi:hypothetical protein